MSKNKYKWILLLWWHYHIILLYYMMDWNDMVSFEYASQPWPGVYSNRQAVAVLESINKCCWRSFFQSEFSMNFITNAIRFQSSLCSYIIIIILVAIFLNLLCRIYFRERKSWNFHKYMGYRRILIYCSIKFNLIVHGL